MFIKSSSNVIHFCRGILVNHIKHVCITSKNWLPAIFCVFVSQKQEFLQYFLSDASFKFSASDDIYNVSLQKDY